ncbi:ABC transporter ATP-binding protein [Cyanobacteria bacterium FACHB-DQ100]|uniref:ABC transporter ATP-binding protein n=1 Tax=Leptolyngbya sp. DQ-M1 TaxID=2933920 RepID=UPI001983DF27|nr:ABC transporter ATP-binding protein [Cyanobacteria bacterium FACHB-DQ100]
MEQITPATKQPILNVIDLTFRHPGSSQPTLSGVNLTVYQGELVLIAGATGSGKSTLLNCVAGIAPNHTGGAFSGRIVYEGTDITQLSVRQRSQSFCTLLQNVELQIFTDQVWEEVVFGLENWQIPPQQIPALANAAIHEFGLAAQRQWLIQQLSAGQKQRLLIACLLTLGQPVLLLDEPLAYLDASGVEQLLHLLRSRVNQGQTVLLVEHRIEAVRRICDRVFSVRDGQLLEQSPSTVPPEINSVVLPQPFISSVLLLQTQDLSWNGYPPFPDLQVHVGETVLLKGDNGCGKTTLLKLLSGLLKPTTGRLEILGREMSKRSVVEIAAVVGFVLQNPNHQLFADSVRSEVLQPGVSLDRADTLLEQLSLKEFAEQHPQSLSQGQKRRLALGAVLARQPQICLLDEITVGQDPHSLALMLQVLRQFTQQGGALILTSHDPISAAALQARQIDISFVA